MDILYNIIHLHLQCLAKGLSASKVNYYIHNGSIGQIQSTKIHKEHKQYNIKQNTAICNLFNFSFSCKCVNLCESVGTVLHCIKSPCLSVETNHESTLLHRH